MLMAVQYRSQVDARRLMPSRRVEDLIVLLKSTERANQQLLEQVALLKQQVAKSGPGPGAGGEPRVSYQAMTGPGLSVTVTERGGGPTGDSADGGTDGTSAVLHGEDLLKIVNQLRTGGAEAIAVNGRRLTELSEIVTAGQHIVVNKAAIAPPYKIAAIGPADDMKEALALRGGVVEVLQFYGIEVKAQESASLSVPAVLPSKAFRFAKPDNPLTSSR